MSTRRAWKASRPHVRILRDIPAAPAAAVLAGVESWLQLAGGIAEGSAACLGFFDSLYVIAKTAADSLSQGQLFALLVRPDQRNPFAIWEAKMNQALALTRELRFDDSTT
jgi:hypothetical protein